MKNNNIHEANPQIGTIQPEIHEPNSPQTSGVKQRSRKPTNLPPTQLPLFTNRHIEMMATGAPVISATQAYLKTPDWGKYKQDSLYFLKEFGKGRFIQFYIIKNQEQQPEFITNRAEEEILKRYGVMAARLHIVFATYAASQRCPWKEPFDLRGSDLIKTLGLNNTNRMNKATKLKAVAELAWIVGTLGAEIHWYEGELNLCITRKSPIWTIVYVEEYHQPNLFGETTELIEVIIRVMPGAWAEKFLNKEGEQRKKALCQYGLLVQDVFDIDRYKHKLASALALYLTQNLRFHPEKNYRIQTLIESVISAQEIENIRHIKQYRSRFVNQFYNALETLTEIGFKVKFTQSFPKALLPTWAELPDEQLNKLDPVTAAPLDKALPKGFFDIWLNGVVIVTGPPILESAMTALEEKKSQAVKQKVAKSSKKSDQAKGKNEQQTFQPNTALVEVTQLPNFTGDRVKQMRQSQGWTQAYLASLVGKSVSWVKLVESGRRNIQADTQETLQRVFSLASPLH